MKFDPKPVWLQQSPILISTTDALPTAYPKDYLVIQYPNAELSGCFAGHDFWFDNPPVLWFHGQQAVLERLHIHSRSEHWLDGCDFDFEIHFVNTIQKPTGDSTAVVIGVFFEERKGAATPRSIRSANDALKARSLELKEAKPAEVKVPGFVNPVDFLPVNRGQFFRYEGSLTTEPHTEVISWVVMPHLVQVAPEDVADLKKYAHGSAHPPQPLNRRFVLRNFT